ncbi:MAG: hypothetical protein IJJ45_03645 [Clostridia bacterium]|nr:hypothetical protein [Clostridia bacterium]
MKKMLLWTMLLLALLLPARAEGAALPPFDCGDGEPMMAAVCDYLLKELGAGFEPADAAIPFATILETDDADPGDVRVWGLFGLFNYTLRNTTLMEESGCVVSGLLHLRTADGAYEVTYAEWAEEGEGSREDEERIFGARPGLLEQLDAATEDLGTAQLQSVSDYVNRNSLPVTQYQSFGWAPVELINAPETPEAEQIIHYESPLGYAVDYDLRRFSYIEYGDGEEGLAGVEALEGIGVDVTRREEAAEAAVEALSADLEQPVAEAATFGADAVPATWVRDGALRPEVDRSAYVVALPEGGCLVFAVNNTYYAVEGDPVVGGGDAALAEVLATIRLL